MPLALCLIAGAIIGPFISLKALTPFAASAFLFLSGLELNLADSRKELPVVLRLWVGAFFLPLVCGFTLVLAYPDLFCASSTEGGASLYGIAMILAIALSVSAVPVILKILQELSLLRSLLGRRVILTATLCDIAAWILFVPLLPIGNRSTWIVSYFSLLLFFVGIAIGTYRPLQAYSIQSYLRV